MSEESKICTRTNNAVKAYVADILAAASSFETYQGEFDIGYRECLSSNEAVQANSATITSELGVVIVFPDFRRKSAKAAILSVGVVNAMKKEGFDEEYIEAEGNIYGHLLTNSTETAEMFGYYLTHRVESDFFEKDIEEKEN